MQELELMTVEIESVKGIKGSGDGRGRLEGLGFWQADNERSRKIMNHKSQREII